MKLSPSQSLEEPSTQEASRLPEEGPRGSPHRQVDASSQPREPAQAGMSTSRSGRAPAVPRSAGVASRVGGPLPWPAWTEGGAACQEPKPSSRSRSLASRGRIQTRTREGQEKGGRGQGASLLCKAQMKRPSPPCAPRITLSHQGSWVHRQVSPALSFCQSDRGAQSIIFAWSGGFLLQGEAARVHRVCCDPGGEEMPGCPRGFPPVVSAGHWGKVTRLCRWGRQAQAVPGKEKVCGSLREL